MAGEPTWHEPVTLEGKHVRLEPLALAHLGGLVAVGLDPPIWDWMPERVTSEVQLRAFIERALEQQAARLRLPFATVERGSGQAVGSTSFLAIEPAHRRIEIGYTWLGLSWQRTALNSEAKLLMLRHAFDVLGCNRVEFKTDARNEHSRRALAGIGATEEGTLRWHMVTHAPGLRDSVYFSIIAAEWPAVRDRLEARLEAREGR